MTILKDIEQLLSNLRQLPKETEWVEFKHNYYKAQEIGEYISALSNSACLHSKEKGYLVFGVENETHRIVGTSFKPKQKKVGNQELENWLATLLSPRIDFIIHEFQVNSKRIVLFEIDPAINTPVRFKGIEYIRVGSSKKKLSDHPGKERKIWRKQAVSDWSAMTCKGASIGDLEPEAILKASREYKQKHRTLADEVESWDVETFLNKARLTKEDEITRAAILLLGREESAHFLSPSVARMTWILRDDHGSEMDYAHFGPPFILNVERALSKVRNLSYRYLPSGLLFPIDITQYDQWVIREALHNCIAHQDYELRGTITIIERPDELTFGNVGAFIPGEVETVLQTDYVPNFYRNNFLAQAMVSLNMIDTIGSGIRRMYQKQRERFFPLPDYDLTQSDKVTVKIAGTILDENYTQMLLSKTELDLGTVLLLDKVQKRERITPEGLKCLRRKNLVEGRSPNIHVSADVASVTADRARYIRFKGFDEAYYQKLVVEFIRKYGSASREDIDALLMDKLPEILTEVQKRNKINRLLSVVMSGKRELIRNVGSRRAPKWVLLEKREKNNRNNKSTRKSD